MEDDAFPETLDPVRYYYPPELFADREVEQDDSETISVPIADEELVLLMAKYTVAKAICTSSAEVRLVKIARGETADGSFMNGLRKTWNSIHGNNEGLEKGDVELVAEGLGVYEIIWPFNPTRMQEAIEAERQLEESLVAVSV